MSKQRSKPTRGLSWKSLKDEWREWFKTKAPVLAFGAKFGVIMILLYGILALPVSDRILYSYLKANARASSLILNLLGQGTQVSGVTIRSVEFGIAVKRGCDAVEPAALLCGAILAFPGAFRRKLAGMLIGTVILQVLNLVRIVTLFLIGSHVPAYFPTAHLEVWPALFIIVAILCFAGWKGRALEE